VEGKFSLRFLAALSLGEGNVTLDKFTDEKVNDPLLIQLRKKVHATLVRELGLGARVAVRMKDGTIYRGSSEAPKGDPANPMSFDEIEEKFRNNVRQVLPKQNLELVLERIKHLERLSDIQELVTFLQRP
jgi:2-methylcitrate dehydratase PrpD